MVKKVKKDTKSLNSSFGILKSLMYIYKQELLLMQ
jgi:hypothetical protein